MGRKLRRWISLLGIKLLQFADYPTCLAVNCTCAQGWPCLDCDPTDTEPTHICPSCGIKHYMAREGQDQR